VKYPSTPGRSPAVEADRMLTRDEARRIAANIAKLRELPCLEGRPFVDRPAPPSAELVGGEQGRSGCTIKL
jgi:hypothetical protein